jgi:hypothetical protein
LIYDGIQGRKWSRRPDVEIPVMPAVWAILDTGHSDETRAPLAGEECSEMPSINFLVADCPGGQQDSSFRPKSSAAAYDNRWKT